MKGKTVRFTVWGKTLTGVALDDGVFVRVKEPDGTTWHCCAANLTVINEPDGNVYCKVLVDGQYRDGIVYDYDDGKVSKVQWFDGTIYTLTDADDVVAMNLKPTVEESTDLHGYTITYKHRRRGYVVTLDGIPCVPGHPAFDPIEKAHKAVAAMIMIDRLMRNWSGPGKEEERRRLFWALTTLSTT